ncbi:MAG: hypothetical protein HY303_07085 [Candidatus Wallbacteria bacterium]|nr:hypothetical protein [Candidatus Wallbacteria bacterium]
MALALLVPAICLHKAIDHDEIAHVHSAWMVSRGLIPDVDFQARHHPLYYQGTAWLCGLIDDPGRLLVAHRALMALNLGLLVCLVVEAGRRLWDLRAGLAAGYFLLTSGILTVGAMEVRPDAPQATLSFLALLLLLPRPGQARTGSRIGMFLLSGAVSGVALCVLQKALAPLAAMAPALLWASLGEGVPAEKIGAQRLLPVRIAAFAAAASLPCVLLLVPILSRGFDNYLLYCWRFNASYVAHRPFDPELWLACWRHAPGLWVLAVLGIIRAARTTPMLVAVTVPAALGLLMSVVVQAPYKQYLFWIWPILALAAAAGHRLAGDWFSRRLPLGRPAYSALLVAVTLACPGMLLYRVAHEGPVFERYAGYMRFLERNIPPAERVFDDDHQLNVRRLDTSFNWFGRPEDFADLSEAAGRDMFPDRVAELKRWRPRIVVLTLRYPAPVHEFFQQRYVPGPMTCVFLAGAIATADADGRAQLPVWIAARYDALTSSRRSRPRLAGRVFRAAGETLATGVTVLEGLQPSESVGLRLHVE